jgi:cytidylate kinase
MIVTIDGPVASGKSTVARLVAHELGFFYINSGLLFRACAYILMRDGNLSNAQLARLTSDQILLVNFDELEYVLCDAHEQIMYKDENITPELRSEVVAFASSIIATNTIIRASILSYERFLAAQHKDIIIDGRDTGSVVFPQAELKIYLTACPEIRARRWQRDQEKQGTKLTGERALDEVNARDLQDKKRAVAPLMQPIDAHVIDSSDLTIKDVIMMLKKMIIPKESL